MKLMDEMSVDKLRGGYYTPAFLVHACFGRIARLIAPRRDIRILEPSAGDGAFVRNLPAGLPFKKSGIRFTCVELVEEEAAKCQQSLDGAGLDGVVEATSFFDWACKSDAVFDAVVGNPPFVRYQFVDKMVRSDAESVLASLGQTCDGVANLWIPFVLVSLSRIRLGGAFALVLPAELFSIKSAGQIRHFLLREFDGLTADLYPRDSFPEILQDVIVLSGRRASESDHRVVTIVDHSSGNGRSWQHDIPASRLSWTRLLLTSEEREALALLTARQDWLPLGRVATLGVSIVTGANGYFTVNKALLDQHDLGHWARPLLAKTADCPGLIYEQADHKRTIKAGRRAFLLDFAPEKADPRSMPLPAQYIALGEKQKLHTRFKCRIRNPWYRVPGIVNGTLMLTKRSHQHHRLLINKAGVFTTDTVYRGDMKPGYLGRLADLVGGFHNSATLLSAEIEGRNYGGGVLELVPSEIQRLLVPMLPAGKRLSELDKVCRANGGQLDKDDQLVAATNKVLLSVTPELQEILRLLEAARQRLRLWRFKR
ncbi:MAG: Modification methylase Eco57IB [Planctomycetes bacterium ADurb.Bin126]|nr:MAG: Modification methylase Eco57IB [Planctomycetes bacterium ADurb.Bin126]HOD83932.1 SAM-dependent methyltransferase [Phycisphaerae bacterium]HQL76231.1 SAM-dependent methyltransferase [Phycisphaerae bacterium]